MCNWHTFILSQWPSCATILIHWFIFSIVFIYFQLQHKIYCKNKIIKIIWAVCLYCHETLPVSEFRYLQNCKRMLSVAVDSLCDWSTIVPLSGILVSHTIYSSSVHVSYISLHLYHAMKGAWHHSNKSSLLWGEEHHLFLNIRISNAYSIIWLMLISSYKIYPSFARDLCGNGLIRFPVKGAPSRVNRKSSPSRTTFLGSGDVRFSYKKHLPNLRGVSNVGF